MPLRATRSQVSHAVTPLCLFAADLIASESIVISSRGRRLRPEASAKSFSREESQGPPSLHSEVEPMSPLAAPVDRTES